MNDTRDPAAARPRVTQEMLGLYDEYTHVSLDRRGFIDALTRIAGGAAAAAAALTALESNHAKAAMIAVDDPRVAGADVTWTGATAEMGGYLVGPAGAAGPLPGVLVIHENRGLRPYIRDVARRLAVEGFVALAPDFLHPFGGTPEDEDAARALFSEAARSAVPAEAVAAAAHLRGLAATTGAVGAVGFCFGGGVVNRLAVDDPELRAAVAFYGRQPDPADAPRIRARMQLHYAGLDARINAGIESYRAALEAAGVAHEIHLYDGVNHAFHNDANEARYDKAAAELAWSRTVGFLREALA